MKNVRKFLLCAAITACGASEVPHQEPAVIAPEVVAPTAPVLAPVVEEPAPSPAPLLMIDTHADTPQAMLDFNVDISTEVEGLHLDLPKMRRGGLSAVFMSIWVDPRRYPAESAWQRAQALMENIRAFVAAHPDEVVLCDRAQCVRTAHENHRIAFLMGIEGAHALGQVTNDETEARAFARLREARALGVRYMTLTWTNDNAFGHASTSGRARLGLTARGRRLVALMNELNVVVDVSHVSDRSAREAIGLSVFPVIASHSSARALAEHPRNLPDDIIQLIQVNSGAVCVNYYARFIDHAFNEATERVENEHRAEFDALPRGPSRAAERAALLERIGGGPARPGLETLVAHFSHIAELGGPGTPCLGSDFDGVSSLPAGLDSASDLPVLVAALEHAHLPVREILGENVLRVLEVNEGDSR